PRPPLDDVQRVAVRVGVLVDPDLLVLEPDRIDDERVTLPAAQLLTEERRIGIVRVLAFGIDGDQAEIAVPVHERDLVGALQNLERQTAGVVPRNPANDAETLGIDGRGEIVFQRRFTRRREWELPSREILA